MHVQTVPQAKPLVSEIDLCGQTHPGNVRPTNADHFLVASFHRAMRILASSLSVTAPSMSPDSRGFVILVADGVGKLMLASEGSEQAIISVARDLTGMAEVSLQAHPNQIDEVVDRLRTAMMTAHQSLLDMSESTGGAGTAATTLTIAFVLWPRLFLMHAGDSRAYRLRDGKLVRLTTDQTMAQVMIDAGAMTPESAEASNLRNVLVSALGASQIAPQVEVLDLTREDVHMLCTDGLTRHVSDDEIEARLLQGGTSERICSDLIGLALERGGKDNVTVVVVKAKDA